MDKSARYEIRPRSFGEILDGSFQLYRDHFKTFLLIASVILVPNSALMFLQQKVMLGLGYGLGRGLAGGVAFTPVSSQELLSQSALMLLIIPVVFIVVIVQGAALTIAISNAYLGQPVKVGASFRRAAAVLGPLAAGAVVYGLGVAFGMMLCLIPGIVFLLNRIFYVPAIALEGKGYRDSFRRSKALVLGSRQRIGLMVLLLGIIQLALSSGLQALMPLSIRQIPFLGVLLLQIPQLMLTPLYPAMITLAYFDARVRKEGFDLEMLSRETFGPEPILARPVA